MGVHAYSSEFAPRSGDTSVCCYFPHLLPVVFVVEAIGLKLR